MGIETTPEDTISEKLWQSMGVLNALLNSFDDKTLEMNMPDERVHGAIDAAYSLVRDAREALDRLYRERAATARRRNPLPRRARA